MNTPENQSGEPSIDGQFEKSAVKAEGVEKLLRAELQERGKSDEEINHYMNIIAFAVAFAETRFNNKLTDSKRKMVDFLLNLIDQKKL